MRITWRMIVPSAAVALALPVAFAQQTPQPPQPPQPAQAPQAPRTRAAAGMTTQGDPYMGVGIMDIDSARAKALKLREERGVEITRLEPGGPADKAGIKVNDVVLEYDGQRVQGQEQFQRMVHESVPGRPVKVGVWRNGAMENINVTIENRRAFAAPVPMPRVWGDAPDYWPAMPMPPFSVDIPHIQTIMQNPALGVECEPLGDEQQFAEFFGVKDGLLVKMVNSNSAAERAGIKAGDVIVKVDDTRVGTMRELTIALRAARQKASYQVTVVRNRKEMQITVPSDAGRG